MQSAIVVANYLIRRAGERGLKLTPLSLQKLLYFVHGHAYEHLGRGAVREPFEAWRYGPVVRAVYWAMPAPGANPIEGPLPDPQNARLEDVDRELASVAEGVLDAYGNFSAGRLVAMTHVRNGPWEQARAGLDTVLGPRIDDAAIERFFRERPDAA